MSRPEARRPLVALAAAVVAYNVLHHLGALPDGLGAAGRGTRWADWLDLATPYLVLGPALVALAGAGTDRRGWALALTGAGAYVNGHAVHLAANSIGNVRGDAAPVHLWDEVVGHWLWYAGVALIVVALVRAVHVPVRPGALVLAVLTGVTWTTNALEGTTAVASLAAAVVLTGWALRRPGGSVPALAGATAVLLLGAWGLWHAGFPAPSAL